MKSSAATTAPAVPAVPASAAPTASAAPMAAVPTVVDPASVGANELGEIPVLMYHQVKENPKGDYDQSPEHFKAELQRLYDEDYRPVTAADFVVGKINVAAGKHAMVMTFDDGTTSQAAIGPDGNPTSTTALGMMEDFGKAHPDFHPTATFYVNANPFQDPKVLPWLVAHGYEVGVHTVSHANLKQLSDEKVQQEIGANYAAIEAAVPGYKITTMALPFGVSPVNVALAHHGTYNGNTYDLASVMLVGANPSVSPFAATFNPLKVARIRSGPGGAQLDATYWLDFLKGHPALRFTSGGNPDKISFPAALAPKLAASYSSRANPYSAGGGVTTTNSTGGASSTGGMNPTGGVNSTSGTGSTTGINSTGGVNSTSGTGSTTGINSTGGANSPSGSGPTGGMNSTGGANLPSGIGSTGGMSPTGGASGTTGAAVTDSATPKATIPAGPGY